MPMRKAGMDMVTTAPRQPSAPAMAMAISGVKKKLAVPPIWCKPSARPWLFLSTDAATSGEEAG
jgi:hypothetical protein